MSDGMGWMDGIGLSYTAVTPRASLQSNAKNLEHFLLKIVSVTLSTSMSNFMSANLFFVGWSAGGFWARPVKKHPVE